MSSIGDNMVVSNAEMAGSGQPDVSQLGVIEQYPGAVLVVDLNGAVLSANQHAGLLVEMIDAGMPRNIEDAIKSALSGSVAQINPLLVTKENASAALGEGEAALRPASAQREILAAYDTTFLPWEGGRSVLLIGRDITLERNLRAALIESRQRYRDLLEAACDFSWETDTDGRFVFVTPRGGLAYSASELVGASSELLLPPALQKNNPFTSRAGIETEEYWLIDADNREVCILLTAIPLYNSSGQWAGVRGFCQDITSLRQREFRQAEALHRERTLGRILKIAREELEPKRMLSAIAECLLPAVPADSVLILHHDQEWQKVAHVGQAIDESFVSKAVASLTDSSAFWTQSASSRQGQDCADCHLVAFKCQFQGSMNGLVMLGRSSRKQEWNQSDQALLQNIRSELGTALQQYGHFIELEKLSATDPLTGLFNRRSFEAKLSGFLQKRKDDNEAQHLLLYMDLNNFKQANDAFGHQEGDRILCDFAEVLKANVRKQDLPVRLGGDEFVVLMKDISPNAGEQKVEALIQALQPVFDSLELKAARLGVSVGGLMFRAAEQDSLEALLSHADRVMYAVKQAGKDGLDDRGFRIVSDDELDTQTTVPDEGEA
ncbi:diguanylate cyclase domain-containing protein [Kiloniella sp. b19]|uniref:diguanylate cyclase domain-containing protein n=1 Tax=Kiloniella sp. GXU_MW_B19 TaxID=3141326 RepID=UPI0031DBCD4E